MSLQCEQLMNKRLKFIELYFDKLNVDSVFSINCRYAFHLMNNRGQTQLPYAMLEPIAI